MSVLWLCFATFLQIATGLPRKCDMITNACLSLENGTVSSLEEAESACKKGNHELLSIHNINMHHFVRNYVKNILNLSDQYFFINLKRENFPDYRSIVTGDAVDFEPATIEGNFLIKSDGIVSKESGYKASYICQMNVDSLGGKCLAQDSGYFQNGIYCYKKNHERVTWYEARNNCTHDDGDLADKYIYKVTHDDGDLMFWIGYSRISWYIENADPNKLFTKYTNWKNNFESTSKNDDNRCVLVGPDFTWQPSPCRVDKEVSVICMTDPDSYSVISKGHMPSYLLIIFIFIGIITVISISMLVVVPILYSRHSKFSFLRQNYTPVQRI